MAAEDEYLQKGEGVDEGAPTHHPSAPEDELFDISTTVDPSYIISLIRKLLPSTLKNDYSSHDGDSFGDPNKKVDVTEESVVVAQSEGGVLMERKSEAMDIVDHVDNSSNHEGQNENLSHKYEEHLVTAGEDLWEEYGCVLWDLAASGTHAEFMVLNLVLEVLLANLMVSKSARITEISLGILGNLACHEDLMKHIVSTNGLIKTIVEQLFLHDTQCLIEACRLLSSGLQSKECLIWAEALQSELILHRVLWIAENTLNLQLIEKSVGLLLAILEGKQEVGLLLLPPLMKLGLSNILMNLLAIEVTKLTNERLPERYSALDVILRAIEALSVLDKQSQEICSNAVLLHLLCKLIRFSDKSEVPNACVTAGVVIANVLSDRPDRVSEIAPDLPLLQGLFDLFPFSSDDLEARSALWNVITRLLLQVQENEMSLSSRREYVSVLVRKSDIIEDELLDHPLESGEHKALTSNNTISNARSMALKRIISILNNWTVSGNCIDENDLTGDHLKHDSVVRRLLDCCIKYTKFDEKS